MEYVSKVKAIAYDTMREITIHDATRKPHH
jgi:hypothetical protein